MGWTPLALQIWGRETAYGGGSMVGAFLRLGVPALAILATLVLLPVASVSPALAALQPGSGNGALFKYSGSLECPSPPVGWDPTTATAAQLRFYGLPLPRARSGSEFLTWVDHIRHFTQHVCPSGIVSSNHTDTYRPRTFASSRRANSRTASSSSGRAKGASWALAAERRKTSGKPVPRHTSVCMR